MDHTEREWRSSFPGAAAADLLLDRLEGLMNLLEEGEVQAFRRKIQSSRWRRRVDLTGIPNDVLEAVDDDIHSASVALRASDVDLAKHKLLEAHRLLER